MELYQKVCPGVLVDKMSRRGAARYFGIDRKTVDKMLVLSAPPPHGRQGRTFSCKLEGLTDFIGQILIDDRTVHAKQQHTVIRIFERLRDERGFTGGETIFREYVAVQKRRTREVFVPLSHRPGHAPVDFGPSLFCGPMRSLMASRCAITISAWTCHTAMRRSSRPIRARLPRHFAPK